MKGAKPKVGITVTGPHINNLWLILGVWWAGGLPVLVTAEDPKADDSLDAILLTGGNDIHPTRFGGTPKTGYNYDPARDAMEADWVARSDDKDLPMLAICRGLQMLNVVRGGNLHVDVRTIAERRNYPGAGIWPSLTYRKKADVERGSILHGIVGAKRFTINALHTQAADAVGTGLTISARDGDGITQGLEDRSRSFCVAVQFHPELLLYRAQHRAIFKAIVQAAMGDTCATPAAA